MGTTYKINMSSTQDLPDKVAQIQSEQSALLTSLGVTIAYTSTSSSSWELKFIRSAEDNPFKVMITDNNSGQSSVWNGSFQIGSYVRSCGQYAIIECMEKSILVAFSTSLTPNVPVRYFAIITKNDDDTVTLICPRTSSSSDYAAQVLIKEAPITDAGSPQTVFANPALYVGAFDQYALANVPRKSNGNVCDNAFIVLAWSDPIECGIGRVNDVDHAMCRVLTKATSGTTECYCMFACK